MIPTALALLLLLGPAHDDQATVVVVVGAPGTPEYGVQFGRSADLWRDAAEKGGAAFSRIGDSPEGEQTDRDALRDAIASSATSGSKPLWVVLIGHGTFDGREAKFNLRGPDVSAADLAGWVAEVPRPLVLINTASSSGPFLVALKGENRVVITATRSGDEQNFAHFGRYLSETIADPAADLDRDSQVSLLEAYLAASARLAEFYKTDGRLASEHPLLDDNGDGLGTPAEWFRGVRATRRARTGAEADGLRAHQIHLVPSDRERSVPAEMLARRDDLERQVADLRDQKDTLPETEYYAKLEPLLIDLARLYAEFPEPSPEGTSDQAEPR